jgi:enamine deaminase RidA (YjgF/YER057c/UK114 family)
MSVTRQTVSSGYPFEENYGYARAVRVGDQVFVSGTTARPPHLDGDAYTQLAAAIETVATALKAAGAELRHVVRTVIYVVDAFRATTEPCVVRRLNQLAEQRLTHLPREELDDLSQLYAQAGVMKMWVEKEEDAWATLRIPEGDPNRLGQGDFAVLRNALQQARNREANLCAARPIIKPQCDGRAVRRTDWSKADILLTRVESVTSPATSIWKLTCRYLAINANT